MDHAAIKQALQQIFAADSALYQSRGFQRRSGYGKRTALINIDLANAWNRADHAFSCEGMDVIIPGVQRLLAAFRARNLPVVFTTMAYDVIGGPNSDMGLLHLKVPVESLKAGSRDV